MVFVSKIFRYAVFIAIIIALINTWLRNKSYMVQYRDIEQITLKNIKPGLKPEQIFANIERELRLKYQGHIIPRKDTQWIFINSGGWMGSMYILHASLTEYILFFGTAINTSGHSGRYWANVTDTIISGTFRQWPEGQLESRLYKPGDTIVHTWGEVTAVQWTEGTYMVEYGKGFIPSTLTFALADTIFGTTDFVTMFYTLRIYSKALLNEALFLQQDLWQMINTYLK